MFFRLFAIFAMLAVAFADPKPQVLTYPAVSGAVPLTYSAYTPGAAYSPYVAAPLPYAYSSYYLR